MSPENKYLKPQKGIALYHQLEAILIELITSGQIKENEKIPAEMELCQQYNVSRITVRQAIVEMEQKGYVYKVHGKGTFVSPKVFNQELLKFYSFTEEMKKIGKEPGSSICAFKEVTPTKEVAIKLEMDLKEKVYELVRLRLADEEPMMIEYTYLPKNRFDGLKEDILQMQPMYTVFKEQYGVNITKGIETLKSVMIDKKTAKQLSLQDKMIGMQIERITYEENAIIEYTRTIARGDKFEYTVVLEK